MLKNNISKVLICDILLIIEDLSLDEIQDNMKKTRRSTIQYYRWASAYYVALLAICIRKIKQIRRIMLSIIRFLIMYY